MTRSVVATLSIIGAGRVGKTLGRVWADAGSVRVFQIMNRSLVSSAAAVAFIGQGVPIADWSALEPASIVMIATSDSALGPCAKHLVASGVLAPGTVVFHCSGAVGLEVLTPLNQLGVSIARLHPLRSFAVPERATPAFPGTYCGLEGDTEALRTLEELVHAGGGHPFRMPGEGAAFYHAAAVLVSNYLVALVEAGLRCSALAGFERVDASAMLRGLVTSTLDNVFEGGTVAALTGPIARGDVDVVRRQIAALAPADPEVADAYRALGILALDLSERQGSASSANLARIRSILGVPAGPSREG